ncbi:MAG TPA: M20 aminoacylase family protein [Paraburkholderia sp.]|jgi:amidohydrolase|nr:M20 aminoacylase family protein [Paraburkholderia sp.]
MTDTELLARMVAWRRHLHQHPETAFEEIETARFVAATLRELGWDVHEHIGRTGVVGTMTRGDGPAVALRADMDALPIAEANTCEHRSRHDGRMHACGHDGHTTMLLGAAALLAQDAGWQGTVRLIFQPAEEVAGGGRVMLDDGLFERFPCEAVFGLHNWPGLPLGRIALNPGAMMASFDTFEIRVDGRGSHAAMPEEGIDALVCASHVVIALQTIVSRRLSPKAAAVVSVTQIHGGEAWNVLPDCAVIRGTVRCFDPDVRLRVRASIDEIAAGTAYALGATATVSHKDGYPATINSPRIAEIARDAARATLGDDAVVVGCEPSMASEDFAFLANAKPGAYVWLGVDGGHRGAPLHNPHYDFNDDALMIGASYWVNVVKTFGRTR